MSSRVVVLIRYTSLAGEGNRAAAELAELVATVMAVEKECHGITLFQDTADPTRITLVEDWPTEESFLGPHLEQPHIREFMARGQEFLTGPPEISFARTVVDLKSPGR